MQIDRLSRERGAPGYRVLTRAQTGLTLALPHSCPLEHADDPQKRERRRFQRLSVSRRPDSNRGPLHYE